MHHPCFWVCGNDCKSGCGSDLATYSHCNLKLDVNHNGLLKNGIMNGIHSGNSNGVTNGDHQDGLSNGFMNENQNGESNGTISGNCDQNGLPNGVALNGDFDATNCPYKYV